jgi:membrane fusion protein (multidrug efflux system)
MSKRPLILGLILATLIVTAAYKVFWNSTAPSGEMPPAIVAIEPVKMENWQTEISAIGTLVASQGVVIKPEISGRITEIYFRSGDYVKANVPLVQINPAILKAELIAVQAKAKLSKADYERGLKLFDKKVFSQADLDKFLATYQADIANVAHAQAMLDQTLIRAPFAGRIGLRMVDAGSFVNSGENITNLNAIDPLRIDFKLPEVYLSQIAAGQTVTIISSAYPKEIFKGKVYAFDSQIDLTTRSLGVRATLPNKDHRLLPGAFVEVTLQTGTPKPLVTIPETAVSFEADGAYVYRVIDNKAVKTFIKLGARKPDSVAVISGLAKEDKIITAGSLKVVNGMPVIAGK